MKTTPAQSIRLTSRPEHGDVEIRARLKSTGKLAVFGYCHPATAALIRSEGLAKHINLITLPR